MTARVQKQNGADSTIETAAIIVCFDACAPVID